MEPRSSASEACAPLITDQELFWSKKFWIDKCIRSVLFPKNSYSVKSIEEWQDIILTELEKTNDILINTKT